MKASFSFSLALLLIGLFAQPAAALPVDLDLTQYTALWTFDDPSNRLGDVTGHGNNLTVGAGTPTYSAAPAGGTGWGTTAFGLAQQPNNAWVLGPGGYSPGPAGSVANLNGGVRFDTPVGLYTGGDFTFVVAQRRTDTSGSYETLMGTSRFRYQNVGGTLQGAINGSGGSFGGSTPVTNNDWNLIALRYNNTTHSLESFKLSNTSTLTGPALTGSAAGALGLSNMTNLDIGMDSSSGIGGTDAFIGQFDFVLFDNRFLTNSQLQDLLSFFNDGPPLPLTPEPASIGLFGLAVGGIGLMTYLQRKSRKSA